MLFVCDVQMPKLSYAQIAQKSKETSADIVNSDRSISEFDEVPPPPTASVRDPAQSLPTSVGAEPPWPQRGGTMTGGMSTDPRPTHVDPRPSHPHHAHHSHGRQRGAAHTASADEMRHRDYNGVASAARPLP